MRAIKLMPDYECFPLWEASPDVVGNIDPETLPISAALRSRLAAWAEKYDATLDMDDPIRSGFPTPEGQHKFEHEGKALAEQLRLELGERFNVIIQI